MQALIADDIADVRNDPFLASFDKQVVVALLDVFLKQGDLVAIADIDTRKLTRIIREKGAQSGCIMTGDKPEVVRRGAGDDLAFE